MTWNCFRAVRLNGRLRFEVLHPVQYLGVNCAHGLSVNDSIALFSTWTNNSTEVREQFVNNKSLAKSEGVGSKN